jgi:hypothetical protein
MGICFIIYGFKNSNPCRSKNCSTYTNPIKFGFAPKITIN